MFKIISMNKSKTSNISTFYIKNDYKIQFDSLIETIGYSNNKNVKTTNYTSQILEIETEINYLTKRKTEYNKEIELKKERGQKYEVLWSEVRRIDDVIHQQEKRLFSLKINSNYYITLSIYDDNIDLTSRRINWVNMPGGSYDILWIENPTLGLSMSMYQGGSFKIFVYKR